MHPTKLDNQWRFRMKARCRPRSLRTIRERQDCRRLRWAQADVPQVHKLLHGKDEAVYGDSGDTGVDGYEER